MSTLTMEEMAEAQRFSENNTWDPARQELYLGSGYGVQRQPISGKWVAFSNGFMLMNGLVAHLYESPADAVRALGFHVND